MSHKNIHWCINGVISGIILYFLSLVCAALPYWNIPSITFCLLFAMFIFFGAVTIVALLFYKRSTVGGVLIRSLLMFISSMCMLLINGHLGTVRFVHKLLGIRPSSSADNVSGMLVLTFFTIMIVICIISILIISIISICCKKGFARKNI